MSELIPVNIVIADRNYRLRIEPKDEEMVRKTAGLINDKITEFKANLAGKDMQDYLAMTILWFATEQQQSGQNLYELESVQNQIETLKNSIEKAISGT